MKKVIDQSISILRPSIIFSKLRISLQRQEKYQSVPFRLFAACVYQQQFLDDKPYRMAIIDDENARHLLTSSQAGEGMIGHLYSIMVKQNTIIFNRPS
jgi:hypothetical protein